MSELDDLNNLLKSAGWLRYVSYAKEEWSTLLATHTEQAANSTDDVLALNKLRQILAAKKAVDALIAWPAERVRKLEHPADRVLGAMTRGGF